MVQSLKEQQSEENWGSDWLIEEFFHYSLFAHNAKQS